MPKNGLPTDQDRHSFSASQKNMMREVESKQRRLEQQRRHGPLEAIAVLGVIGWSITIPTLVGAALGIWIDGRWPGRFSWTLILLVGGLIAGCVHAWLRVKEDQP